MRVALCGPSGTGKTTLAKFISEEFNIPFIKGSASLIMDAKTRKDLNERFGYEPTGHQNVINESSKNPAFGIAFQKELLRCRTLILQQEKSFITDRSPVDNIAYFLTQCSHNATEIETRGFINNCRELARHLTHIINIKVTNPEGIEDNGSRVTNKYFQEMMDSVFQMVLNKIMMKSSEGLSHIKVFEIDFWDLQNRKESIKAFLNG